ncbi:MAG: WYL domain-containing protein [Acidimicrobiaceae bacterium]|nr:WYL domain-containing protein [Acidimicrobiaceae bacterium]MXV86355.1 WYL domain-containing protein [Acidimicrobiales bacterium]MCY3950100.1 WYL domain-containing protein [Acidimicrobiaceae bacterium]MDE0677899.1 WYL domain-containing protein [Acidimicrobiaceae bacterium]MYB81801.1 WYL domain-containing protein [Acidimicrobiales bacterium]
MAARSRPDATERVMELVMYLLARDVPKTREEIWRDTGLYAPDGTTDKRQLDSARASFERDKALIRNLGVRITESIEHDGATSYTIRREDYFLPDLQLTPDEQLALRFAAARVDIGETWDLEAVAKLTSTETAASGGDGSLSADVALETAAAQQTAGSLLPRLAAASAERAQVRFAYGGRQRDAQPLGLLCRAGYWYLAAREDGVVKTFRVDRMESDADVGERGAFARADVDVAALLPSEPMEIDFGDDFVARVQIDATMAQQPTAERGRVVERHDDGSVTVTVRVRNRAAFRVWLLDMGRHAVVESPPELVDEVTSWLRALASDAGNGDR